MAKQPRRQMVVIPAAQRARHGNDGLEELHVDAERATRRPRAAATMPQLKATATSSSRSPRAHHQFVEDVVSNHPLRVRVDHHGDLFQTINAKCVPAIATDRVLWLAQTIVECGIAVCEASHTAFAGRLAAAVVRTRARLARTRVATRLPTRIAIHRRPLRSHTCSELDERTRESEEWREMI